MNNQCEIPEPSLLQRLTLQDKTSRALSLMGEGHASHTSPSSLPISPKGKIKHSQQGSRLQGNAAAREGRKGHRG